ncbi:Hypothetical predicted protein [Marmota monax]|uniref:Paralemmin-1 n=1 Tax=Marmota monax TaxID=9995 RepID=A0A5E4CW45_MARMO|nr:Hypothetical predicted protein [Marmota monax]
MEVLEADASAQQERLQAIAERRRRQAEIEGKRRQLEEDRRQLQHLKSKALRERWLLEGTPSSASDGEDMRRQMQEDEQKVQLLEGSISRLEREIDVLENGEPAPAPLREDKAAPSPARTLAPSPAKEQPRGELVCSPEQTPPGTPKGRRGARAPPGGGRGAARSACRVSARFHHGRGRGPATALRAGRPVLGSVTWGRNPALETKAAAGLRPGRGRWVPACWGRPAERSCHVVAAG